MYLRNTQNKLLLCILFVLLLYTDVKSQDSVFKNNAFSLGIGSVSVKDAERIPSGMPGTNYSLNFISSERGKNKQFEFSSRISYLHLSKNNFNTGSNLYFSGIELNTGGIWSRKIPFQFLLADYTAGIGGSLNGYYFYPYTTQHEHAIESWSMSADLAGEFEKRISSFILNGQIKIPLFTLGHFDEYQNIPTSNNKEEILTYYLLPNNIAFIDRYIDMKVNLSVIYRIPSSKKINFKFGYEFDMTRTNVFNHLFLKRANLFYVGIVF